MSSNAAAAKTVFAIPSVVPGRPDAMLPPRRLFIEVYSKSPIDIASKIASKFGGI